MEAKWSPNDQDDGGGPLPLSSQQRQQLLNLEDTIRNSPNPEQTLQQVADSNQMPVEELVRLLERNRRDIEAAGGIPISKPPQNNVVWKLLTSLTVLISKTASKHPRSFALTVTALLCLTYVSITAPRTGLVLSTHRMSFISGGPTTVWNPPVPFIRRRFLEKPLSELSVSAGKKSDFLPHKLEALLSSDSSEKDDAIWQKIPKSKHADWQYMASAQVVIDACEYVADDREREEDKEDEEDDEETYESALKEVLGMMLEHASNVLTACDLTEFVEPNNSLRLVTSDESSRKRNVLLVVQGMGDFRRFGLQPLRVTHRIGDLSSDDQASRSIGLTLSSVKDNHFDGHLQVSIEQKGGNLVVVRSSLLFPKGGKKLSKKIALQITEKLSKSIETSIRARTQQSLARRSQSSRFQGKAQQAAKQRRKTRFDKEQALEEMAADRRRRWQRQNPNSGHYRPSGERMRSPKNAMYY